MILKRPSHVPHICMVGILRKLEEGPLTNVEVFLELPARYQLKKILPRTSRGIQVTLGEGDGSGFDFKHHFVEYRWNMESMVLIGGKKVLIKATFMADGFTHAP